MSDLFLDPISVQLGQRISSYNPVAYSEIGFTILSSEIINLNMWGSNNIPDILVLSHQTIYRIFDKGGEKGMLLEKLNSHGKEGSYRPFEQKILAYGTNAWLELLSFRDERENFIKYFDSHFEELKINLNYSLRARTSFSSLVLQKAFSL